MDIPGATRRRRGRPRMAALGLAALVAFAAAVSTVLPMQAPAAHAATATFSYRGWVTYNREGAYLPGGGHYIKYKLSGATVSVAASDGTVLASTTTDANGHFILHGLPFGESLTFTASHAGMAAETSTVVVTPDAATQEWLGNQGPYGEWDSTDRLLMHNPVVHPAGSISGQLLGRNADGSLVPVYAADVTIISAPGTPATYDRKFAFKGFVLDHGDFSFDALVPGTYYVYAQSDGTSAGKSYGMQFYGGGENRVDATPITVTSKPVTGLRLILPLAATASTVMAKTSKRHVLGLVAYVRQPDGHYKLAGNEASPGTHGAGNFGNTVLQYLGPGVYKFRYTTYSGLKGVHFENQITSFWGGDSLATAKVVRLTAGENLTITVPE